MNSFNFKLIVRCFTFNQVNYIREAMDGFTMQQTSFPYLCVIVDDASTDNEPEIISDYLKKNFNLYDNQTTRREETDDYIMTFAQHCKNPNCFFAVYLMKYNHYSIHKSKKQYFAGLY